MIVVNVKGGLGNQMFQYALYRRLKEEGKPVKLASSWLEIFKAPYLVDNVFNTASEFASYAEARKLGAPSKCRIRRSLDYRLNLLTDKNILRNKNVYEFEPDVEDEIQSGKDIYLDGFWQNERWFSDVRDIIQKEFLFKNVLDDENAGILEEISSPKSVAAHVRRYSHEGIEAGDRGKENYYQKAVGYFLESLENATFYIFSNDIDWCRANIKTPKSVFVEGNPIGPFEDGQWKDMMLMSRCPNIIISNSTYSWWGAYLPPPNKEKTVVSPAFWQFGDSNPNLDGWVSL